VLVIPTRYATAQRRASRTGAYSGCYTIEPQRTIDRKILRRPVMRSRDRRSHVFENTGCWPVRHAAETVQGEVVPRWVVQILRRELEWKAVAHEVVSNEE
jgi:hypothetical protein